MPTTTNDPDLGLSVRLAVAGDRDAAQAVLVAIQDDVYGLALRMLGERPAAEDAAQEILVQVLTHLAQFRGDSSVRTWVYRIAVRHLARTRPTRFEELASFETLTKLCEAGQTAHPLPELREAELKVLERELRLVCTEGMLLSLDRDQRIAWILSEIFELDSERSADVLDIDPATFRKRLQRARQRLGEWMGKNCGLVDPKNGCSCRRQIPVGIQAGVLDPEALQLARHPERFRELPRSRRLPVIEGEIAALDRCAQVLCEHPDYAVPELLAAKLRELVEGRVLALFDA
ncbi:MAG: RNA polymerase sigma factor [Deltaproteobacteria bacterium]|nr:RNA polymerase sigma factor [Deltaproteobacteria bacterium]